MAWGVSTRQGQHVGHCEVYLNDFINRLSPWTQEKFEKAGK